MKYFLECFIVERISYIGIGYHFSSPRNCFDNAFIQYNSFNNYFVIFDYYGKRHHIKLFVGKYGLYFRFHNFTYYVIY